MAGRRRRGGGELGPCALLLGGSGPPPSSSALLLGGSDPPPSSRDGLRRAGGVPSNVRPLKVLSVYKYNYMRETESGLGISILS